MKIKKNNHIIQQGKFLLIFLFFSLLFYFLYFQFLKTDPVLNHHTLFKVIPIFKSNSEQCFQWSCWRPKVFPYHMMYTYFIFCIQKILWTIHAAYNPLTSALIAYSLTIALFFTLVLYYVWSLNFNIYLKIIAFLGVFSLPGILNAMLNLADESSVYGFIFIFIWLVSKPTANNIKNSIYAGIALSLAMLFQMHSIGFSLCIFFSIFLFASGRVGFAKRIILSVVISIFIFFIGYKLLSNSDSSIAFVFQDLFNGPFFTGRRLKFFEFLFALKSGFLASFKAVSIYSSSYEELLLNIVTFLRISLLCCVVITPIFFSHKKKFPGIYANLLIFLPLCLIPVLYEPESSSRYDFLWLIFYLIFLINIAYSERRYVKILFGTFCVLHICSGGIYLVSRGNEMSAEKTFPQLKSYLPALTVQPYDALVIPLNYRHVDSYIKTKAQIWRSIYYFSADQSKIEGYTFYQSSDWAYCFDVGVSSSSLKEMQVSLNQIKSDAIKLKLFIDPQVKGLFEK